MLGIQISQREAVKHFLHRVKAFYLIMEKKSSAENAEPDRGDESAVKLCRRKENEG